MTLAGQDLRTLFGVGTLGGLPDGELLERFAARRDEAAFEVLVRRHGPMVWGVCRRVLGDRHDAEDAFQATFLVLARRARAIARRERVAGWLHGVADRTARKARASRARRRMREAQVAEMPEPRAMTEEHRDELAECLDRELGRLPEKYRLPIVLCELEGKAHREAAAELGWPVGTVSGRLSRARALLARRLVRRGLAFSTGTLAMALAREASASPPARLIATTARAAALAAAGRAVTAGVASVSAVSLSEGVLRSLALAKLKASAALLVLALGLAGLGIVAAALRSPAVGPAVARPPAGHRAVRARDDGLKGSVVLEGHTKPVYAVAFTTDGKTLASGSLDGTIRLWDVAARKERATLRGHVGMVFALAFAPDGKTLVSGGGQFRDEAKGVEQVGEVKLWDVPTAKERASLKGPTAPVRAVAFAPDGKTIASGGWDDVVKLWDADGRPLADLRGHAGSIVALAFAPDGKTLASAGADHTARLWDVTERRQRSVLDGHEGLIVYCLAFSPDGKTLATGDELNGQVHLWDVATGRERKALAVPGDGLFTLSLAYHPDGKTLALGARDIRLCDAETGDERSVLTIPGENVGVWSLAFSPDGKILASGDQEETSETTLVLWGLDDP